MSRRGQSIQTRALILGLVPSGFILLALLWFFTSARLADARQDLLGKGELLAGQIALMSEYDMLTGNHEALRKQLNRSLHQEWVARVRITDANGELIAESPGPDASARHTQTLRHPILQPAVELGNDPFTEFAGLSREAEGAADRLGDVELILSLDALDGKRNQIVFSALLLGLVMVLLVMLLVRALVKAISSPLDTMHASLERLANGHYGHYLPDQDVDGQLGELIDAVNALSRKLAEQDAAVKTHIRDLEDARKRAEAASAAKGEFLALMSHELRTPLNGVIGMLQLLEQTTLNPTQKEYADTALRSAEHLLAQISDILNFSLLDRGKITLDPVPCRVTDLVDEVADAYRPSLEAKGGTMMVSHANELAGRRVSLDPQRVRQLLGTLLGALIKYAECGEIRIHTTLLPVSGDQFRLQIDCEDDSAPLNESVRKALFDGEEKGLILIEQLPPGFGISLSLVRGLLELMGGSLIGLPRESGHTGNHYRLLLPVRSAARQEPEGGLPDDTLKMSGHILVVEDNLVNQKVVLGLLRHLGFTCQACYNGKEAITLWTKGHYDLILMDCQMPVMDGLEATQVIRRLEAQQGRSHTPVIALTANALDGAEERCRAAGMDDFLAKPVRRQALALALARHLPRSRTEPVHAATDPPGGK